MSFPSLRRDPGAFRRLSAIARTLGLSALLGSSVACSETDGEVGSTDLGVDNQSSVELRIELVTARDAEGYGDGALTDRLPPGARTDFYRGSGGFGHADPPSAILSALTLTRATDGATVLTLDPLQDSSWEFARDPEGKHQWDVRYTVVITESQVDAAMP